GVGVQLDLATVLAQWASGGLFFCWVTTRRREVGIGYGWLLRISFGVMAVLSLVSGAGDAGTGAAIRNVFTGVMALAAGVALVQPGLGREPIRELVKAVAALWPFEVVVYLIPAGMVSVLNGTVNDGYGGLMGWMWVVAVVTTIGLVIATWFALKEKSYSAVMAATGLLYLAILTGFGMDLLPRALLG